LRLLLLVNSSASAVTARARVVIRKALSADHQVRFAETSRRGHASRLAQGAAAEGLDAVVVLGGDGTINEAANGLVGTSTALGVLPGGSTNVFARTIGMTNDPVEATGELLASLATGGVAKVQVGQVNGRYFLFHVGAGFDAAVVAEVEKRAAAKRYLGAAAFLAAAASTWAVGVDRHHHWFTLRRPPSAEGGSLPGADNGVDGLFAICLNTGPYTFLGSHPLDLLPGARLGANGRRSDGHGTDRPGPASEGLGVIVFDSISLPTLLGVTLSALRGRNDPLSGSRHVWADRGVREVELVASRPLPYQVDGDYLGETDRLIVRCVPDALNLVLPPSPAIP
jgi:diacylglycerol kinase family enzyme